jgi:hypothetical protein
MTMSVKLNHPAGASMLHSESLATFLRHRIKDGEPFFLGHWLITVDDAALRHLRSLTTRARGGDSSPSTDDLLVVALTAQAAELVRAEHEVNEDVVIQWINILHVAAAIEGYRRMGWLVLDRPLSIQANVDISLRFTVEGERNASTLRQGLR